MERNVKVEVIALWETDGQLRPLRFRFTGEDHQLHSAGIDQVLSIRQVAYVGVDALIFLCRACVEGRERMLELKNTIRSHSWTLLRWIY